MPRGYLPIKGKRCNGDIMELTSTPLRRELSDLEACIVRGSGLKATDTGQRESTKVQSCAYVISECYDECW